MTTQSMYVGGQKITFEWHPNPTGDGGLVSMLPGVQDFEADSLDDARDTVRSLYRRDV